MKTTRKPYLALFNKGKGRTEFRKALQKISDSLYIVGPDSLRIPNVDFYTNSIQRGRLTKTGNLLLGTTTDNGNKFQVIGSSYFNGVQQVTGATSGGNNVTFATFNPTITSTGSDWSYLYGQRFYPTMNFSGNNQQAYAVSITHLT